MLITGLDLGHNDMNFYSDEEEEKWMMRNAIDWDTIIPLHHPQFPTSEGFKDKGELLSFFEDILTAIGDWASHSVAEKATRLDREGAGVVRDGRTVCSETLQQIYDEIRDIQGLGLSLPKEFGGLGLPFCIDMMALGLIARGDLSTFSQLAFGSSIGDMILRFCDGDLQRKFIPKIVRGEVSGSMCLTEPNCGSDIGQLRTTATRHPEGNYLLNGHKIFISNAGGGVAFILARVKGAPQGTKGLSLFFAEQEIEREGGERALNYKIVKNENKMGLHGSFTCEVVYENTIAHLVGKENEGFSIMLHLMNEARLATSHQALGCISAVLSYALQYARERIQFGRPIAELPLMKRNLEDYETERDAIRALLYDTNSHFEIAQALHYKKKTAHGLGKEEEKVYQRASRWLRKRTPLIKYYSCETATTLSQRAIQVLGGYGFMKDYPVERYHRDSFAPLLYEGTSQIQALMALKDLMKDVFRGHWWQHWHFFVDREGGQGPCSQRFRRIHRRFKRKLFHLIVTSLKPKGLKVFHLKHWKDWKDQEKIEGIMAQGETLCQALAYMETLRVLGEHAQKDASRKDLYFRYERLILPRMESIYKDWSLRA